jgi:Tol biopolymer transport system component
LKYLPPDTGPAERKLFFMNADGSDLHELIGPPDGYSHLGSPEWSPDGGRIVLDGSPDSVAESHIFVVDTDDGEIADLGPGCMPSFSRDAAQIVFSQPGTGVMMMNADGTDRRIIDRAGWGVQFSPDGKYIAYGKAGNVTLRNVATGDERELLRGEDATRYDYIYWNLGWSHDSRSIAFKGRNPETGEDELAVADADSPNSFQVLYSTTGSLNNDFTFSPDNGRVLFAMQNPALKAPKLYFCSRNQPGPPTLLPNQPTGIAIFGGAWSSDDRITFTGERTPTPLDWPLSIEPERP